MDWKSIVLNKRMKFFLNIILISSCLYLNWAYPCGVQDILEPSHPLFCQYSRLHNQQPKSVAPNIACLTWGTPFEVDGMSDLSVSLLKYLYSMKVDIQHACEHDPYLQLLLEFEHFRNYISVSTNHGNDIEYHLEEHYNGTLLPIQDDNSNCLSNVNSSDSLTYNKTKNFIETKVTAMKLQGFNL